MKYLKKYNENQEQQDPTFVITKIKEQYPVANVKDMLEKEIKMWEPEESDPNFYSTSGNGEAEDVIINQMIGWFESKYSPISDDLFNEVYSKLQDVYEFLKH